METWADVLRRVMVMAFAFDQPDIDTYEPPLGAHLSVWDYVYSWGILIDVVASVDHVQARWSFQPLPSSARQLSLC